MLKLMKYLKGSVKSIFLIILLLVLQAFCDLSLPSYTSNIVNIGIQQGGVDSHVPEVIREEQMEKITIFIEEKDQKLVEEGYYREFVRGLQVLRKEADFRVDERIFACFNTADETMKKLIKDNKEKIKQEVLIKELLPAIDNPTISKEIEIGEKTIEVKFKN